jgi:hypothetical protein
MVKGDTHADESVWDPQHGANRGPAALTTPPDQEGGAALDTIAPEAVQLVTRGWQVLVGACVHVRLHVEGGG